MNTSLRFGNVGTGMLANIIAGAIKSAPGANLAAVASRTKKSATDFAEHHDIQAVFDNWEQLVASDDVDAVYISTPASVREDVAVAAAKNKKNVLAEKPFANLASLQRIVDESKKSGVALMDATHFTHHPRTKKVQAELNETIGVVQAIRTCFFFPFMDRTNIRFDRKKEPTGAVGDMAWYSMRAITEYMQDRGEPKVLSASAVRDEETGAVIRGAGVAIFENGNTSTFDFGYNAGVCLMDLDIIGTKGMLRMDDFVLDWAHGFAFDNPNFEVGYTFRKEMMTPDQFEYIHTINPLPQAVHMIQDFLELAKDPKGKSAERSINITVQTQTLLDQVWNTVK